MSHLFSRNYISSFALNVWHKDPPPLPSFFPLSSSLSGGHALRVAGSRVLGMKDWIGTHAVDLEMAS